MKNKIAFRIALAAVAAMCLVTAGAANMILNPGFESVDGYGHPTDWSGPWIWTVGGVYSTSGVTISVDSTVSHSGTKSLKIAATTPYTIEFLSNPVYMNVGTEYTVSGWVKTDNLVTGGGGGYLDGATYAFRSGYPPGSGWGSAVDQAVKGTNDWTFFTRTFSWTWYTGNAYLTASHNAWNPGTGTVWFDDVSIEATTQIEITNVGCTVNDATATATVTWTTNLPASSIVEYGSTTAYGSSATGPDGVTSHTVVISGLTPNTLYHYRAKSTAAGYADKVSPDAVMPWQHIYTESISAVPLSSTGMRIFWCTLEATAQDQRQFYWGPTAAYENGMVPVTEVRSWGNHDHEVRLGPPDHPGYTLTPGATYHYKIKSRTAETPDMTFTVPGSSDDVVWYQDGMNGYSGTRDNYMSNAGGANYNSGTNNTLGIANGQGWTIKFTGLGVLPGAVIKSAYITTYGSTWGEFDTRIGMYGLLREWNEGNKSWALAETGEACWNAAKYNQDPWEVPGAAGATDALATPDTITTVGNWWAFRTWEVTPSLTQQFAAGKETGWVARWETSNALSMFGAHYSRERVVPEQCPMLTVVYEQAVKITNVSASFQGTTMTVVWDTSLPASSVVDWGTTNAYGNTVTDANEVTHHVVVIPSFTPNTDYHYRVKSVTGDGKAGQSTDQLAPCLHVYPESISVVPISSDAVRIYWVFRDYSSPSVIGTREVFWGKTTSYGNPGTLTPGGSWNGHDREAVISGLEPNTTYHFKVRDRQTADDLSNTYLYAESPDMTFTTIGPDDIVAEYQQGVNAYAGAADNTLGPDSASGLNIGASVTLNTHSGWRWITKFADLSIPTGATVKKAYLQAYGAVFGEQKATLNCHGLLKNWNEGTGNWTVTQNGESDWVYAIKPTSPWEVGGAKGATDRTSTPDDTIIMTDWWAFRSWDVTTSFLAQQTAGTTTGWIVERDPADPLYCDQAIAFNSKESATDLLRPKLSVVYTPGSLGPKISEVMGLADGTEVTLSYKTVTLGFWWDYPNWDHSAFYVEDRDRSAGIKVVSSDIPGEGAKVNLTGVMATVPVTGERYIDTTVTGGAITALTGSGPLPGTFGMIAKTVGGIAARPGLGSVGLLVSVAGTVHMGTDPTAFYVDDGSSVIADFGKPGVKVTSDSQLGFLSEGDIVKVVGVASMEAEGSHVYGAIRTTGSYVWLLVDAP